MAEIEFEFRYLVPFDRAKRMLQALGIRFSEGYGRSSISYGAAAYLYIEDNADHVVKAIRRVLVTTPPYARPFITQPPGGQATALTIGERAHAEALWKEGRTIREIAAALGTSIDDVAKHLIPYSFARVLNLTNRTLETPPS